MRKHEEKVVVRERSANVWEGAAAYTATGSCGARLMVWYNSETGRNELLEFSVVLLRYE